MQKWVKKLSILFIVIGLVVVGIVFYSFKNPKSMIDKTVVKELDIEKYLGTWYEIARYNHRFEHGLVGVTANYSLRDDGKIKVINSQNLATLKGWPLPIVFIDIAWGAFLTAAVSLSGFYIVKFVN